MSNISIFISFKQHSLIFNLSPDTTTKALYEMVGAKFGIDPNKIKILKNEIVINCDQTKINDIPHDSDKIELTFCKLDKSEEFSQIKDDFLKFCVGKEPNSEEIKIAQMDDVDKALRQIYEGNEELRKCGFIFIPESVTKPKNPKAEAPQEAKYNETYSMHLEEMQLLNEMGFENNRMNSELLQKYGWRPERIVNELIQSQNK